MAELAWYDAATPRIIPYRQRFPTGSNEFIVFNENDLKLELLLKNIENAPNRGYRSRGYCRLSRHIIPRGGLSVDPFWGKKSKGLISRATRVKRVNIYTVWEYFRDV